jgi:hypothetical protein
MSNSYLLIDGSGIEIHAGDKVTISDYGDIIWIVKNGWYKIGNARKNGWYFLSVEDQTVLESGNIDLDHVHVTTAEVKVPKSHTQDEVKYVVIPGTNVRLYDGDIVKVTKYPRSKFQIHCGWYMFDSKQNFGWYLSNVKSGKTLPLDTIDLTTCSLITSEAQGATYKSGPEIQYTRPFTDSDAEMLSRTFITLDSIEQMNNLDPFKLVNGKMVRINNDDGSATYYVWNASEYRWEPTDFGENIKRVVGTFDKPVILADLNPGVYLIYGQYKISKNDPTMYITLSDILTEVNTNKEETYIKIMDEKSIVDYIVEDDSVVLISEYATKDYIDKTYATIAYVDSKFDALEALIQELIVSIDARIRDIAREEDRLYSTDIAKSYIDDLFNN